MKIRNNITILINEDWLRNITRYEQYYNLSLVSYKFLILNLSLTITFIKLGTFFASKSQGGGANVPAPPWYKKYCLHSQRSKSGRQIGKLRILYLCRILSHSRIKNDQELSKHFNILQNFLYLFMQDAFPPTTPRVPNPESCMEANLFCTDWTLY